MRLMDKLALTTRRGVVIGKGATPMTAGEGAYLTSSGRKPRPLIRAARIAGWGFISLGVIVGVAAVIIVLIGMALIVLSLVDTWKSRFLSGAIYCKETWVTLSWRCGKNHSAGSSKGKEVNHVQGIPYARTKDSSTL